MDSLYIMRNLLILFCLMVVFWTNLGNCAGSCDRYTQCHYNETRMHSTVSCYFEIAGNTTHPCYGDGSKVNCSCYSENYQLSSPNNSYLCRPDKWEDGLYDLHCLTASPCDEPDPPDDLVFHSPDFAEGEMYANGTEIMYDCPDGFDLNGHMTTVCLYGVWTYEDANCTASQCDEPAPPDDLVIHSPDFANGEMYANGTEIMYDCPDGWDFNGNMTAVCLYGVWTYEDAYCTASQCDEPAPPDDLVIHSPDFAEGEMYANGTEIMYDCPDGWDFNGNMTAVCLHGVWTNEDAYCTASSCDEPAPPDDLVSHSPDFAEGEMYAHGTEIMYDCPDGWVFNGNMTAVCLYGVWTYEDAYCTGELTTEISTITNDITTTPPGEFTTDMSTIAIDTTTTPASPCDEPAPLDDLVFHSPDFAEGEMYPNGTEIMYDCPDGLALNGNMTAVCLYGVWTYENVYCTGFCDKYTQCHYDETWMHSTVSCNIERAGDTALPCYGDRSNITCSCKSENYQLSSPENSYLCRPDKWEDGLYDLYCLPSPCDEPAPPDDLVFHSPDFAEGDLYPNGIEIMYDCPEGWDFNGHMTAVCLLGVWTYEDAYCTASPCDEPAPPDDKVFHSPVFAEGEMYPNGTEIMYDCPEGWDLNGHMTAVCLYGVWTYEDANCAASPCDKPAPPDDWVPHNPDFAEGEMYPSGTKIIYYCSDNFINKGHRTAVCLYGVWTYEDACLTDPFSILLVINIAICTLLFAVLLIWLVKKHCLRRGTKWIPSVEGVANEQVPPTANDESKFVSKVIFEMRDPNAYQNDVNKEENDVTDHVGDNSPDDSPNNDPEEETV